MPSIPPKWRQPNGSIAVLSKNVVDLKEPRRRSAPDLRELAKKAMMEEMKSDLIGLGDLRRDDSQRSLSIRSASVRSVSMRSDSRRSDSRHRNSFDAVNDNIASVLKA